MKRIFCILFSLIFTTVLFSCSHSHSFSETVTEPSCSYGYTLLVCDGCGYSYTDRYTAPKGHSYVSSESGGGCTEERVVSYSCTACGHCYTESLGTGVVHNYRSEKVAATKDLGGYTLNICRDCGVSYEIDRTPPKGYSVGLLYETVAGGVRVVGMGNCRDTDVVVPAYNERGERVVAIGSGAFYYDDIETLTLTKGIERIEVGAIESCTKLVGISIDGGTEISKNAFVGLTAVEWMTAPIDMNLSFIFNGRVPESLTDIKVAERICVEAFSGMKQLRLVKLGRGITEIPCGAFDGCESLVEVVADSPIRVIGSNAFAGCVSLIQLDLLSDVRELQWQAFLGCGLIRAELDSVVYIDADAFSGCEMLSELEFCGTLSEWSEVELSLFALPDGMRVACEDGYFVYDRN